MIRVFSSTFALLATALIFLLLTGCAGRSPKPETQDMIRHNHQAARELLDRVRPSLPQDRPILVASLVNIDNLTRTTTWGRMSAEQLASAVFQEGYPILEMKLRRSVMIESRNGEFVLSREIQNLTAEHDVNVVLAGTYAVGARTVYATIRLIRTSDNSVLASYDYSLPLGINEKALLGLPAVPYEVPGSTL